jgi:hypothetical protein
VEGLKSFYNGLLAKNAGVVEVHAQLNVARTHRDNLLYKSLTGMVDLAQDVKMYMKSVSGSGNVRYKQISKLAFHTYSN